MACSIRTSMSSFHGMGRVPSVARPMAQTKVRKAFPHDMFGPNKDSALVKKLQDLNKLDEGVKIAKHKRTLCELCPREFHNVVNSLDDNIIDELDYIRVMYKPSMETDQRISVRKKVSKIVMSKESGWTEHELEFFIWVLRYYRVF
jgi:hypothetical protein